MAGPGGGGLARARGCAMHPSGPQEIRANLDGGVRCGGGGRVKQFLEVFVAVGMCGEHCSSYSWRGPQNPLFIHSCVHSFTSQMILTPFYGPGLRDSNTNGAVPGLQEIAILLSGSQLAV